MEIIKTKKSKPPRIIIHADHGLGKSSLAAKAPRPIFIQTEDGLDEIDTEAFPMATTFNQAMSQLKSVYEEEHDYKTLVIDSLDWLEKLINAHICKEGGKESISDFGYGAGFQMAYEQFERVKNALNDIRTKKNMAIILICHSQVAAYNNPLGADYDRHKIKLRDKNAELFMEWADLIGFLHFQTFTTEKKEGFSTTVKAIGGTERVLSCYPSAAFVSKNRYGIKDDIIIPDPQTGWNNLITAIKGE